jgi:G3E family GTPase
VAVLPVTVLTGFLGAGKSTLLARLLQSGAGGRVGLLVNELGQAGIEPVPGRTAYLELAEGCVCCVRNPELIAALRELAFRGDLDRAVVETTGLADPLALTWTLERPELRGVARLDAVVAVVDPVNFENTRCEEWEAQIRCADLVVLSKVDLVDTPALDRAREAVRALRPGARILEGGPRLPLAVLLDAETGSASPATPHARHSDFRAATVSDRAVYRLEALEDLLRPCRAA